MNKLERCLGLELRQERIQRTLLELYENEDWSGLLATAEILNTAWHCEANAAKWLAKEAADNLTEAWQAGSKLQKPYGSPDS